MKKAFINIQTLVQVRKASVNILKGKEMNDLPVISDAFLIIEHDRIHSFGKMADFDPNGMNKVIDLSGKTVLPTWVDSHTHLVYAGNREGEFIDRIKGLSYEEIARKGGGILNSAKTLQATSEEELFQQSSKRLEELIALGTGAIEIKSGYGLTVESELKMLRVIKRLKETYPVMIKATFLAAHALPQGYARNRERFLSEMMEEALPHIIQKHLADFVDVFCETGYFSVEEMTYVIRKGAEYGLKAKVHLNQFSILGGIKAAVEENALTVDHLECLNEDDIEALKNSSTIPVALPNCSYFLSLPYTPARTIIDAELPLALASDYNPGSSPSGNMNQVVSAACIKMNMTPEEAINAATLNGAWAMGIESETGSITVGKKANFIVTTPIPSYGFLPYSFGSIHIESVYLNGKRWNT